MKRIKTFSVSIFVLLLICAFGISCEMEVAKEVKQKPIIRPYISLQPASDSYTVSDSVDDLFAQVWGWNDDDGALSYQWFMFDNLAEYIQTGKGTAVVGSSVVSDTLTDNPDSQELRVIKIGLPMTDVSKTAGKQYYYYLEVTNEDSTATDTKIITVRSNIATISFSAAGAPLFPIIDRQPVSANYQFGRNLALAPLTVRASLSQGGSLTYQWGINTTGNPDIFDNIPGATEASFNPAVGLLSAGKNYFFVKVSNGTSVLTSIPAVIDMQPGQNALDPVVILQPKDALYFTNETAQIEALEFDVENAIDGGAITYQWFSNTRQEPRNGTRISGQTGKTFRPTTTAAGTYYYYAVITNTNPHVISKTKTATANTRAVKIVITSPRTAGLINVTVQVQDPRNAANRYQYIRGYGGMDVAWANFPEQKPEDMETMYNPDWGLGYNINRIMISPANTNINITMLDLINRHRPNYYENVKIVNKYNGYNAAAPWSPPKEWKSNNSINGGGHLVHRYYQQYADYLKSFAKHMYDAGAPIYSVSIQNEPNYTAGYDGCEWEPEEMRDFFVEVGRFTQGVRGYGGGKEIPTVLTQNGESANTPFINIAALTEPAARQHIDFVSRHVYGSTTETLWRIGKNGLPISAAVTNNSSTLVNILDRDDGTPGVSYGTKMEVWMTEHNINSANATAYPNDSTWNYLWRFMNDVDLVMRLNNENAFVWWASKRFYSMIGDGQFGTRNGVPLPRGIGLSHYAKYTIDTQRIATTITGTMFDGTSISVDSPSSTVNSTGFNLDNLTPRITAYAMLESGKDNQPVMDYLLNTPGDKGWEGVEFISFIMWAPTNTGGGQGRNMGNIEVRMPAGFKIGGVSAHKSTSATNMFSVENVEINEQRTSAFVNLSAGQMLSVKLTRLVE